MSDGIYALNGAKKFNG